MDFNQLSEIMREAGLVGAGGAGFPTYAKLNMAADTIILNCAECEPLLKLHRQVLARYAAEITETLEMIADVLEASEVIIAVKSVYTEAVEAVQAQLPKCKKTRIGFLPEIYPAGDEVITVYETTGRVIAPGALPISVGCVVYNVENIYNLWRAWRENAPVTHKYITIAGEVKNPCTLRAPLGITYGELIKLAGGTTRPDTVVLAGGPMTGRLSSPADVVTKTSNAILVMPKDAYIIQKRLTPIGIDVKRAMAACCQCQMCTDLCSRHVLGHPIEPHRVMRAVALGLTNDSAAYLNTFSCSSCGLCELYACGQGLSPRALIGAIKSELQKNGVSAPKGLPLAPVDKARTQRLVPMKRLTTRLGLSKYDIPAPLVNVDITCKKVKLMLAQSIGAPSAAAVEVGQTLAAGDVVGAFIPDRLSTPVHTPFAGRVTEVTDTYVMLEKA